MSMFADVLVAHRWNAGMQTCMCMYGKFLPPLGSPRAWAEHVHDVMVDRKLITHEGLNT